MARALALFLFLLPALAQGALSPLKDHPLAQQAKALLQAAAKAHDLASLVDYSEGSVVSRTLAENR
ncbi:MAG: hypothetical protein ACK41R_08225, partial [Thermus sp.]